MASNMINFESGLANNLHWQLSAAYSHVATHGAVAAVGILTSPSSHDPRSVWVWPLNVQPSFCLAAWRGPAISDFRGKCWRVGSGEQCIGARVQWQLSVRQRLQRLTEWLLWVGLCCRSLRKFTDVFSYETPLQRLKYPVAPSISLSHFSHFSLSIFPVLALSFPCSLSCVWGRCGTNFSFFSAVCS